jgi:hypothetical protein
MRPKHYDRTRKERTRYMRLLNWHNSIKKRRHRQIANLWWYYAGVLFMVRFGGRWMTDDQLIGGES